MNRESQRARDARLDELWKRLDTRKEGHLDFEGLKSGFKRIDHPLKDADHLIRDILGTADTSKDGLLQYEEFKAFIESADRELWHIFQSVDVDKNGKIDKAELRAALEKAGIGVNGERLQHFFDFMDTNNDGAISFEEWRDFLMFMPNPATSMRTIYSYYLSTVNVNPEGDALLNDEMNLQGLGYFLAGGLAGSISRTATAPFDRIKVYLIAKTDSLLPTLAIDAATKTGGLTSFAKRATGPLRECLHELWKAGGTRSFFAGNGLNVVKVLPESAIKFGSFEATKRTLAKLEGVDVQDISPISRFLAGGIGGVVSQFSVYPIDTLKFRMQCEMVAGGARGNQLIAATFGKMWKKGGIASFYRGLPLGLIGIFPYSAIDLSTFEWMKRTYVKTRAKRMNCDEKDINPSPFVVLGIGATSGSVGASIVYPLNVLRTRLQAQGTAAHPHVYTGLADCFKRTIEREGFRGLFKGLSPNLLKVVPSVSISYLVYEQSKRVMELP